MKQVLTISELIRRGLPHTTASSSSSFSSRRSDNASSSSSSNPSPNPNPKILTLLESPPSILVGTIKLPNLALKCPNRTCFQFSDDGNDSDSPSTLCCDIIGLDVRVIGKKIQVNAWNFIPSYSVHHGGGGWFLEVIDWEYLESSSEVNSSYSSIPLIPTSSPYKSSKYKPYTLHGIPQSLSPVFVVPCAETSRSSSNLTNVRGFLVKLLSCHCKLCHKVQKSVTFLDENQDSHSFNKPVYVYFVGPAWCWHSVIVKLLGNVITLSLLKKKSIVIGVKSGLAFVTAENTGLTVPQVLSKSVCIAIHGTSDIKADGECGTYTGLVSGVYLHGMVVELDKEVWLLLTDELLNPPHSIRVGAVVCVRNVHFVNPRFSWAPKTLILGCCYTTSITVQSFAPLETGCLVVSQSHSPLRKSIERLKFPTRLWMLLVISCFREKFSGMLSEEEILGSNHEGLVQKYSSLHLQPSVFQTRNGVFREFCGHKASGCHSEPNYGNLKLVLPISTFIHKCELMWGKALLQSENMCSISCQGKSYKQLKRRTFLSKDIGIILVGGLKVSPSSGRLQLFDKTGSIDVIIHDLISTWDPNSIFEVVDYSLTVEGIPEPVSSLELFQDNSFSCRSVFNCLSLARERNLAIFLHFHLRNGTSRNLPFYPSADCKADSNANENELFHLIRITHKYSMPQKFNGDPSVSRMSRMYVEGIVLPWFVSLAEKEESVHLDKVSKDKLKSIGENCQSPCKRRKVEHQASKGLDPSIKDGIDSACARSKSSVCDEAGEEQRCQRSSFSNEFPCMATIRGLNRNSLVSSSKANRVNAIVRVGGSRRSNLKVFLELKFESSFMYQSLQIGGYCMIKHSVKDRFCNVKFSERNGVKVVVDSTTPMWRLSFPSEVLSNEKLTPDPSMPDSLLGNDSVLIKDQAGRHLRDTDDSPIPLSDICLRVSADVIGAVSELEKSLGRPASSLEEISELSTRCRTVTTPDLYPNPDFSCLLSERNLISLRGDVIAVHTFRQRTIFPRSNPKGSGDLSSESSSYCIHVSMDGQDVKVYGIFGKSRFPTGFGPGINATFHRIIELGPPSRLVLTPLSYMEINSIAVDSEACQKVFSKSGWSSGMPTIATDNLVSSGLISQLVQRPDGGHKRLRCRVVALHVLVLEEDKLQSRTNSSFLPVNIPIAAFVLDDGSCCCRCWANDARAATLLRLSESVFENKSIMCQLERILEKHGRITVRNYGSMADSSNQNLAVSVSPGDGISSSDENLLKFIILRACYSTFWSIVGVSMVPGEVRSLEKEAETTGAPRMPNIYAREVSCVNPLAESRDIIREFTSHDDR